MHGCLAHIVVAKTCMQFVVLVWTVALALMRGLAKTTADHCGGPDDSSSALSYPFNHL